MNSTRIIECVPNFSEGKDQMVLDKIADAIKKVDGVSLLHIDPGASTNRTVFTFAGAPEPVIEAAFQAIKIASELIDMSKHKGAHPRMGATDVCPLVPVSGIGLEEVDLYAKKLAKRVGIELAIPVYLYEASASTSKRRNLADIRSGEYEGLEQKMKDPDWIPDFGPISFNSKAGATVIGARSFLIAYNVNVNTKSVNLANEVAFDIRENGRPKRDPLTQKILKDDKGEIIRVPGKCRGVKAIGWYIAEYGIAQISMNITNLNETSLHLAFEECRKSAENHGLLVTGSELVGLVPKIAFLEAGKYFLQKQKRSFGVPEGELIEIAIQSLGLNAISNFNPKNRIIEYMIDQTTNPLAVLSLQDFAKETASDSPAPGGGSVSAYVGSLGAALTAMVANLTAHKKGYENRIDFYTEHAVQSTHSYTELLKLVDEDTRAFNGIIDAFRLPKNSVAEKKERKMAIQNATIYAIDVPLKTMQLAYEQLSHVLAMVKEGNPNSVSDAGVGALCIHAAIKGAGLNVKINAAGLENEELKQKYINLSEQIISQTKTAVEEIENEVMKRIFSSEV
ncbi:MAG: glutamate formimidoyltransferase [Saprospiraceae bacterium]|nr:glutamate formimidoyltransferase [Saprospiraceae bacterium]